MASETLSFQITGDAYSATRALRDTAKGAGEAAAATRDLDKALRTEIKTSEAAAAASREIAKADKLAAEAEAVLSGEASEAARQLRQQARAAEEAAAASKLAAQEAKGAGGGFAALQTPLAGAIAAGVALAPIAVTLAAGLGGLGLAALSASKDTKAMAGILGPLKGELAQFDASLKPEVLTIFGTGAGIATQALKALQPVAAATGTALNGVLGQVGAEFKSGEWQQFFTFMGQQAGPDLQLVGAVLIDLLKDLPQLLIQLQPAGRLVLILADDTLKAVGALERMHLVLPLLGAAIGFVIGGPLGALAGGLAGVAIQAAAVGDAVDHTRLSIGQLAQIKPVTSAMIGFAGVAGQVAAHVQAAARFSGEASTAIGALHAAATIAKPAVGTLAGDVALLSTTTTDATTALKAYSDLWNLFVGNTVSDQQAILNVRQAFESFNATVKQSGRTSTASQQAFLSIFTTIGTGLETLQKNKASISQLNAYYQTNIDKLNALHNLTPAQRADVTGLTQDYIAWANITNKLSGNLLNAAGVIRNNFLTAMSLTHQLVPTVKTDTDAFATAILKTGTNSRATAADRAQLIADLVKSGVNAAQARIDVLNFQGQINALHGKTVDVNLATSGSGQIIIRGTGINQRVINTTTGQVRGPGGHTLAAGGLISGGTAGRDSVAALLMPGELVVPTRMVASGAVDHLRGSIPGFAAGGVVGKVSAAESGIGSAEAAWGQLAAQAFALAAVQASAKAAATAASGFTGGPAATGSALAAQNFARAHLADYNWGPGQFPPLLSLWNQESGWNAWAVNPSSGAYGIPQSLGHGHPYNLGDYANQVRWGLAYIFQRYGSPGAAWAHEQAFNWYGNGLDAVFSKPTVIGVGDRPGGERVQVTPAGRGGGGSVVIERLVIENHGVIGSQAEADRWLNDAVDRLARQGRLAYALRRSPSAG